MNATAKSKTPTPLTGTQRHGSDVTKLPDGSAFFTATVMSKAEAMNLPVKERPICPICFRISSKIYDAVFQAINSASMAWNPRPGNQVFDSEEAFKIATDLCLKIAEEIESLSDSSLHSK